MSGKLLITGGSGFVAFHIIEEALRQGYKVDVTIRKTSNIQHLQAFDIGYVYMDFTDIEAIQNQLRQGNYGYIIHSAGTTAARSQQEYDLVNAQYTYNLAKAAAGLPLKKFVFLSSLASIGPSVDGANILEQDTPGPVTNYGRSKLKAEQMLATIGGLPLLTFRPTAVYGPRDQDIFIILKTFCQGLEPYIGKKAQTLSFVYAKDLAKLLVDALKTNLVGRSYNVSDGKAYNRYDMALITKTILGKRTLRVHLPYGLVKALAGFLEITSRVSGKTPALNREKMNELTASWLCDARAAMDELGYQPAYDLQRGLEEALKWYKDNKWLK